MTEHWANDADGPVDAAAHALLARDTKAAEELLRPVVLHQAAALAAAWANLGLALSLTGRTQEAGVEWGRALTVWDAAQAAGDPGPVGPADVEAIVAMLVGTKRSDEAVDVARAAMAHGPEDPRLAAALGTALSVVGDDAEAAQAYARSSAGWLAAAAVDRSILDAKAATILPSAGPDAALAAAWALAAKGESKEARAYYERALRADPPARSQTLEAELARIGGDTYDALARADAVLAAAPDDAEALGVRAQALRDLGQIPEAIAALDQLLAAGGGDRFRLIRSLLYVDAGSSESALADLGAVGSITRSQPAAWLARAVICLDLELHHEAQIWFDRVLASDPGNVLVRAMRALAQAGQGQVAEGIKEFEALFTIPPADQAIAEWMNRQEPAQLKWVQGELLHLRGRFYLVSMRYADARTDLTAAIEVIGPRPDVMAALAQAILLGGDPAGALAIVETLPPGAASTPAMLAVKAAALSQLDHDSDALSAISKALEASPDNPSYKYIRAIALRSLGRLDAAVTDLADVAASQPQNPGIRYMLADVLRDLNRPEEALAQFAAAEALNGDAAVFIDHASLLKDLHKPEEALQVLTTAVARFPANAALFLLRGGVLADQGNYAEAANAARHSIELDPDQPAAASLLGEYLRRLGKNEEALKFLDRALAADPDSYFALGTKGQVLLAMGDDAGAVALLRQAVGLAGDDRPRWLFEELVRVLSIEGSPAALSEALEYLDRYLASGRQDRWALGAKAETLRLLDRSADGMELADAALQAGRDAGEPDDEGILGTKANLLIDLSRAEEALELADRLLASASAEHRANYFAAQTRIRALLALSRHAEALVEVDDYIQKGQGNTWWLLTKANILGDYREFQAALDLLDQIHEESPYRSALLGYCRNRLADPRDAIAPLTAAVTAEPRLWWCWAELGDAYRDVGKPDPSRQAFEVVLTEALSSTATDYELLVNGAWAAQRTNHLDTAVELAQRAVAANPASAQCRLFLGTMLLVTGRGLAAINEIEAGTLRAAELPDPRLGAATLDEAVDYLKRLGQEGGLNQQQDLSAKALSLLRTSAAHLRHPDSSPPPHDTED